MVCTAEDILIVFRLTGQEAASTSVTNTLAFVPGAATHRAESRGELYQGLDSNRFP